MDYAALQEQAHARGLAIYGGFHPGPGDACPPAVKTLLLLGPDGPGFWPRLQAEPEFTDAGPDPLDRWSRRVIGAWACALRAKAVFPFTGPPYRPFLAWATASGRAWSSPVGMLVHDRAGLMISFRGALGLKSRVALPAPPAAPPCEGCARPCLDACPVGALTGAGYDVGACHAYLATGPGRACLTDGCAVRLACPVSAAFGRLPEQSAHHMRYFHP